jgi:hypothetical protein
LSLVVGVVVLAVEIYWLVLRTEVVLVPTMCFVPGIVEPVEDETRVVV